MPISALAGGLIAVLVVSFVVRAFVFAPRSSKQPLAAAKSPLPSPVSPSPSPPPSPSPSPSPKPARGSLLIHGTGDVNLDPNYITNFQRYGYAWAWTGLGGLFERDDLTIVNLECAVSNLGSRIPKKFNFRGDPAALPAMRAAGVEVANMGNNHGYDYGPVALLDERKSLIRNHIAPVGGGKNEDEATKAAVFEINGWKIAVVGIANVVEPDPLAVAGPGHPGVACNDSIACMVRAVKRADSIADLVIVTTHWGVELFPEPNAFQIEMAHALIDAGADMIFGHHSHRLGSIGSYKARPIFWSLGNFVWPAHSTAGATTAVAEVRVTPAGKFTARLLPAFIELSGHPVLQ
jgi:poly-gamma-glutamate capsule biosynthesis protein CapA/YwtB (metallophosphatase superfamily)